MSNSGPFTWRASDPERVGSVLLETRLRESLANLARVFKISVPQHGRHQDALEVLRRWNHSQAPINLSDQEEMLRLAEAHRLAWETFLITVAADENRRNARTPFTRAKLRDMVGGGLVLEGRDGRARNTQFELYVAAMFRLPGCSVSGMDEGPDLLLRYGQEDVGVETKRIRSNNVDQVQKQARTAARQIEKKGLRGWIALNLDSRFEVVDYARDECEVLAGFSKAFDSVESALRRPALKSHVLGFILFGYVYSWHPPLNGTTEPRLHWGAPFRWQSLTDEPEEATLFQEFHDAWWNRWLNRRSTLCSRDFTGLL